MCSQNYWENQSICIKIHLFKSLNCLLPFYYTEASCGRNLDDLIESLGASEPSSMEASPLDKQNSAESAEQVCPAVSEELEEEAAVDGEKVKELLSEEVNTQAEEVRSQEEMEAEEDCELMPFLEESAERNVEDVGPVEPLSGLRRRNRPEWTLKMWQIIIYYMKGIKFSSPSTLYWTMNF